MLRPITLLLSAALLLPGCEKLIKAAREEEGSGSLDAKIRISTDSKPEIVAAFDAIASATRAHNLVLVENMEKHQPANGPAYSAGINQLDKSAKKHGGLAKQIIEAVANARIYEKDMFVVFDNMHKQFEGMKTWGANDATQRRAYIQIIDSGIRTFDRAIAHLESGEEPLLREKFDKKKVPRDVSEEFLRLRKVGGGKIHKIETDMFREQRAALRGYRMAATQATVQQFNLYVAEAKKHDQKASQLRQQLIAEIRKQLSASTLL